MGKIYMFYGAEKYDLNQNVEKIKKQYSNLELGVNLFYISSENIDSLSSYVESVTFFGTEKLIIIKDTKLKFDISCLENLDNGVNVIIIEDSVDKRTSDYKKITKIAECVEFKSLDEKKMREYITQMLKKYNINITSEVATYMQGIIGEDKSNCINELNKIVSYLNSGDTVTKELVDQICSKTLNAKIFDVLAAIINKNKVNAIEQLDEILKQKEPIVKIYIMLYKQIKQMYMIKYMKEKGESDIAAKLEIHPFVYKNLSMSCTKYSLDELKDLIYSFDEYDEKTKIGEMDFEIGLKKIICSM